MEVACLQQVGEVVQTVARAWNNGDSKAFASNFTEDGDLVNIYGMRLTGKASIAGVYDMLFRGVFRRSRLSPEISTTRRLCENTILARLRVGVQIPLGAMAGDHDCICSVVLQREGQQWRVSSLHNTLVSEGIERQLVA